MSKNTKKILSQGNGNLKNSHNLGNKFNIKFVNKDFKKILINKIKNNSSSKKVLLIDCNIHVETGHTNYSFGPHGSGYTPFGLRRISSYLDREGIVNNLIHISQAINKIEIVENWDIIGLSSLTPSINHAFDLAKKIKIKYPQKLIIGGAEHFALDFEWILKNKSKTGIDYCCTMQGEPTLLALAKGMDIEDIGSIAYVKNNNLIANMKYPRLTDLADSGLFTPSFVNYKFFLSEDKTMPELGFFFKSYGSTQTGSGCNHSCTFCTNGKFLGKYISNIKTAKREIKSMADNEINFFYARDAMINSNKKHFNSFVRYMNNINSSTKHKIAWFAYVSVNKEISSFKNLAKSGCLMIGVGIEDILGNRRQLGKGESLDFCTKFINKAKEDLLVRALLILGLPSHYSLTKKEIKKRSLEYMKENPQALYRINIFTPIPGTIDWFKYEDSLIYDVRKNPSKFKFFDNMHSAISPNLIRNKLKITQLNNNPKYVQNHLEWYSLRDEIIQEYLYSKEHNNFLNTLKNKYFLKRKNLLYDIALKFKDLTLTGIKKENQKIR